MPICDFSWDNDFTFRLDGNAAWATGTSPLPEGFTNEDIGRLTTMGSLDNHAQEILDTFRGNHLRRRLIAHASPQGAHLVRSDRTFLNFCSNDYLGLANHPAVREAFQNGVDRWGAGSGASRLVCGSSEPIHDLETSLATMWNSEAALVFSSGYACSLGVITGLIGKGDTVVLDKLSHASLIDGARLSGARQRVFHHNDMTKLEAILKSERHRFPERSILVITESLFSMEGDVAPLGEIAKLKERYGAWLLIDEAHALGVCGPGGRGLVAESELGNRVELRLGTLGKAVGTAGGFVTASRAVTDLLAHKARSLVYSTAAPPAVAVAAQAGLDIALSDEGNRLRDRLRSNIVDFTRLMDVPSPAGAILPIQIGPERKALAVSQALENAGILVPAIRYPTVARNAARLRLTMSAAHRETDIKALGEALATARAKMTIDLSPAGQTQKTGKRTQ